MSAMKGISRLLLPSLILGACSLALTQDTTQQSAADQADNTKMNQRDRNGNEPTADRQTNGRSDREITQQIRNAITHDKSLSTYAHNVKVITQNGRVTLRGPVRSEEEKQAIESKAAEVAGASNVASDLNIQPKK